MSASRESPVLLFVSVFIILGVTINRPAALNALYLGMCVLPPNTRADMLIVFFRRLQVTAASYVGIVSAESAV